MHPSVLLRSALPLLVFVLAPASAAAHDPPAGSSPQEACPAEQDCVYVWSPDSDSHHLSVSPAEPPPGLASLETLRTERVEVTEATPQRIFRLRDLGLDPGDEVTIRARLTVGGWQTRAPVIYFTGDEEDPPLEWKQICGLTLNGNRNKALLAFGLNPATEKRPVRAGRKNFLRPGQEVDLTLSFTPATGVCSLVLEGPGGKETLTGEAILARHARLLVVGAHRVFDRGNWSPPFGWTVEIERAGGGGGEGPPEPKPELDILRRLLDALEDIRDTAGNAIDEAR